MTTMRFDTMWREMEYEEKLHMFILFSTSSLLYTAAGRRYTVQDTRYDIKQLNKKK